MTFLGKLGREVRTVSILARMKRRVDRLSPQSTQTFADFFEAVVDRRADAVALRFETRAWSYREVDEAANRVARWSKEQGLERGEVVALFMENRPEFLFAWIGLAKAGVQVALINTNLVGKPLAHAVGVSGASTAIVGAELLEAFEGARADAPAGLTVWVWGDARAASGNGAPRDLAAALAAADSTRPPAHWRDGLKTLDNLFFIYTSGTTGLPKAARFSHFRFVQAGAAYTVIADIVETDAIYCCLPLYHTAGGVIAVSMALLNGATLVLRRRFSASAFWDDCRTNGVTVFQYIGELCRYLLHRPESAGDRDHKVRCAVGNGLRPDIWETFQRRFGIRDIREFYGATEGNFAIANLDNKVGSVGRVPPYLKRAFPVTLVRFDVETETHVRGADGFLVRCAPGEAGEAIGRIPPADNREPMGRFEGYSDRAATEKKILRDAFENGDAWYRTGDLLSCDAEGYYYFVDRIGDTFRWKGENVATSEVAEVLSTTEGVLEANVYGVKVPGAEGRAGMAAIVPGPGFDLERFYQQVGARLPGYARPIFLRLQERIDTTGTFKHRKVDLVREGYDPSVVSDRLFVRDERAGAYVALDSSLHRRILDGGHPV